jgi:hypothetical protein
MRFGPSASFAPLTLAATVLLSACGTAPTPTAPPEPGTQPITLRFTAQVAGLPFACGQSYTGIGSTRSTITPSDYRFYVSELHLIDTKGRAVPLALTQDGTWQLDNIALLDFENGSGPAATALPPPTPPCAAACPPANTRAYALRWACRLRATTATPPPRLRR